jgi:hypothetical protein
VEHTPRAAATVRQWGRMSGDRWTRASPHCALYDCLISLLCLTHITLAAPLCTFASRLVLVQAAVVVTAVPPAYLSLLLLAHQLAFHIASCSVMCTGGGGGGHGCPPPPTYLSLRLAASKHNLCRG